MRTAGKAVEASGEERQEQEGHDGGAEAGEAEGFAGKDFEIGVKHASHRSPVPCLIPDVPLMFSKSGGEVKAGA